MKALVLLALLWGMASCVSSPSPMPMEASYETPRLQRHWMERESREKPRRKEHVSGRAPRESACESAPGRGGQRASSTKGQRSKRS
jgi:hypothetical protein